MAAELIFNFLIGLGILFLLFEALELPQTDNPSDLLGASGFPVILCVLGLIVLAVITLRVLREKKQIKIPMLELGSLDGRAVALNVALLFIYIWGMNVIGFILSTLIYLAAAGWLIGYRRPLRLAIYAAILTTAFTAVFGMLFYVPLPRGIGQLRELSYMIY